ncbi:MAG: DUF5009 domain-containing protein [Acidobacteriota bacterium]
MPAQPAYPPGRVVSLDALRGFDMFWIIGADAFFRSVLQLVDHPWAAALRDQLEHSAWHGFTFYDLIFPLFLFIVGAALPFSISKRLERGDRPRDLYRHIVYRAVVLYLLGLVYNHILDLDFANMRWTGVLHRIAVCYLVAALLYLKVGIRGQAYATAGILLGYWAVLLLVPVPGVGAGVLTPEGNLAGYLDRLLLPGRFCCYGYGDNEGILSTLPAVASVLFGGFAGHLLRNGWSGVRKTQVLLAAGLAGVLLGLAWDVVFPINKLLWTSSYAVYAAGWSFLLLGLFYWIIDVRQYRKWAFFFVVIGLNPITIYVLTSVFDFGCVAQIFVHGFIDELGVYREPVWLASILAVEWLFLYFLYRQRIFLKV